MGVCGATSALTFATDSVLVCCLLAVTPAGRGLFVGCVGWAEATWTACALVGTWTADVFAVRDGDCRGVALGLAVGTSEDCARCVFACATSVGRVTCGASTGRGTRDGAGLVGITANCDRVGEVESLIIGAVAGVLVVAGIVLLDKLRIDDPVGAFPVHGLCGVWGGIATGLFGDIPEGMTWGSFVGVQAFATLVICAWAFITMFGVFGLLKVVGLLRVSEEDEILGLDLSEHGMHAYPSPWVASDTVAGTTPVDKPMMGGMPSPAGVSPSSVPSTKGA